MSISTNSTNGDFTPTDGEVNCESISLDNDGQSDGKVIDQQQPKEFREKCAKMEMNFKIIKLELEKKLLEEKLMHKELMQTTLLERISELETQVKQQNKGEQSEYGIVEKMEELLAREMEKQQTMLCSKIDGLVIQRKVNVPDLESAIKTKVNNVLEEQQKKMDNFIVTLKEHTNEFLKAVHQNVPQPNITEKFSETQQNCWDFNACHNDLVITGPNKTFVNYHRNKKAYWSWRSVFAKHPILPRNDSTNIFYFEISVINLKRAIFFGFAIKHQAKLDEPIYCNSTCGRFSNGNFWINGSIEGDAQYAYDCGDTVGFGVNLTNQQLIFTKNGLLFDITDLFFDSSFSADSLFPFISLRSFGDKIEANFGPNFKFGVTNFC